jgi:ABC-type transport system involved in multi-copper enzyme maturation permease subunit
MLGTLVRKEIIETILDLRFTIVTLLCVVLIPLGMYVSRKDYEQRLADYQQEHQMYRNHYGKLTDMYNPEAHGYRPPSALSIFAMGLDPFMPDRVVTSKSGLFRTAKRADIDNPESLLFGKADLLFNVSFVVSLAALIFTFNCISGEKERGTLRQMISNSIPRSQILLSKIAGNYITLLIPFVVSLLIALIVLDASPDISILSSHVWPVFLIIVLVTLLFILAMVTLGICLSTLTRSSITAIVMLLLAWVILVLAVPKVSPMIAKIICPIESRSVISLRKQIASEDIKEQFNQKRRELFDKCLTAFGVPLGGMVSNVPKDAVQKQAYAQYDKEVPALKEERQKRTADAIRKIEQDYRNKRNVQASIGMNLSRISPVSCYTYLVSGLSGTGVAERDNFNENAQRYQDEVKKTIYDNIVIKTYGGANRGTASTFDIVEGFDPSRASFPDMKYQYTNLAEALQAGWVDVLLLFLFNILFFLAAFLSFRRYDVR